MCTQTFSPIFGIFSIFDRNFAKTVAPPGVGNGHYLMRLKGQSVLEKQ